MRADLFRLVVVYLVGGIAPGPAARATGPAAQLVDRASAVLWRDREAPEGRRIRSAFFAARPQHQYFGRLLARVLNSIKSIGDGEIWSAVLARAFAETYAEAPRFVTNDISVVNTQLLRKFATFAGAGAEQAKAVVRFDRSSERSFAWQDVVVLGHPRCGSASLADALTRSGLHFRHEHPGRYGMVSWWHTGFLARTGMQDLFFQTSTPQGKQDMFAGAIWHYLRNPHEAIPSIILENEHKARTNNSFRFRQRVLQRRYGIDLSQLPAEEAAAASYALWNDIAAEVASHTIKIEVPDLSGLFPDFHLGEIRRLNTSARKYGVEKTEIDLPSVARHLPAAVQTSLEKYVEMYR